jgi:phosphomannomutase
MTDAERINDEKNERAAAIERWIALDLEHGPQLRDQLANDPDALTSLFDGRIAFGTAGLRAAMAPGPRRMNRLVVRQTTEGLMNWLPSGAKVVIGYDARHHSHRFANDVAEVVVAKGGRAELIDRPAPTPVLALAVLDRAADAGVMITASHNPAADNGYKLYLGDGIQLVSPADGEIAAAIDQVAEEMAPDPNRWEDSAAEQVPDIAEEALQRHREAAIAALATDHRNVNVLYTAMHGVGGEHLLACFEAAGFPTPAVVAEQFHPDPDFPTAPFPNPEEAGAFDLSFATAAALEAQDPSSGPDIIVANDPDADRLAVGVKDDTGAWRRLSGDEVGALLIDHVLSHWAQPGPEKQARAVVASSIVSSRFIDRMARRHGVDSVRTLTGFKWVARPIVERPDDHYLFGYEEALGYCIGDRVRDKDGVSAALVMAELAAGCKASDTTVWERLDQIIERNGLFATSQVTVSIAGMTDDEQAAAKARAVSLDPVDIGGIAVASREDLSKGERLPPTSGVVILLEDQSRLIVRPSGTEPKIKAYLEVIEEVTVEGVGGTNAGTSAAASPSGYAKEARHRAELRLEHLAAAVQNLLGS